MSKSRKNPNRDKQLKDYKNKHKKQKSMNQPQQMPEVRQSPVWKSNDMLEVSGQEWEQIFNFIESSSAAFMAANAVMSRNIINGKVKLKFEKLNKDTFQYEDMTSEEEAPYQAEFQKAVANAINAQKEQPAQKLIVTPDEIEGESDLVPPSQEGLPQLDALVDAGGKIIKIGES